MIGVRKIAMMIAMIPMATTGYALGIEGTYKSGTRKPVITVEMGNRGQDEFRSSACKGKVYNPSYNGNSYEGKGYIIFVDDVGLTIERDKKGNKCFPEGRYLKEK